MTTKYIQLPTCKLAEFTAAATTSFDVAGFLYNDGTTAVDPADIGDVCFATLEPRTPREELISFTIDSVTSAGIATITAVRGLSQKSPYGTGGAAFDHQNGSDFVISNNPGLFNRLTAKDNTEEITAQWTFPTPTAAGAPVTKSYAEAQFVYKTGAQSIAGVKTFTDKPVVPVATEAGNPIRKDTFDSQTMKLTGNQTVEGVKTFDSSPVVPTATTATQAMNKSQVESYIAANSGDEKATEAIFGQVKLDVAADDVAEPIAIGVNSPINESERSVDPADDAGKLVKLEADGKIDGAFFRTPQILTFTSSGTWTKDAGLKYIVVEGVGGGGGGAGPNGSSSVTSGAGGGAGGYFRKVILASALSATETVTIGTGGTGAGNSAGGNGGTTSFGSHCSATGGGGAQATSVGGDGGVGGIGSDGDFNASGGGGGAGSVLDIRSGGVGGSSLLGGGASAVAGNGAENGITATGKGGGGSGAVTSNDGQTTGGSGAPGIVIVTEYY